MVFDWRVYVLKKYAQKNNIETIRIFSENYMIGSCILSMLNFLGVIILSRFCSSSFLFLRETAEVFRDNVL